MSEVVDKKIKNAERLNMSADQGSTFLDIGSGFGKPVFHAAMQTGCKSFGIEIVPARVMISTSFLYDLKEDYAMKRQKVSEPAK